MARLIAWLSLFLLVACSSAASRIASPDATELESDLLGGAPDARLVLRLDKAAEDPVYGGPPTGYDRREPADPELEAFVAGVTGIEVWFVADGQKADSSSALVVVRGRPNFGYLQKHEKARALFARETERLPTGVRVYDFSEGGTHVAFFILPSGSWVIATGRIVGRVRYHFFSHGDDPPPVRYEPDALLAMWVGPGVMRLADLAKQGGGFEGLSLAIRSSARGDMEASATFVDDKHANEAQAAIAAALAELPKAQKALADECPAWQSVRFELRRDGRTLTGRVSNLPPLVRAYRSGACRRRPGVRG
ncbi:MAG: hypothetical protein IT375_35555 [Polyangiaceae bacterium]|jgi:hypothetical protein|nr:hypothetical protein [Polyangiaceae bacterium]